VIEQITYLLFIRRPDELLTLVYRKAAATDLYQSKSGRSHPVAISPLPTTGCVVVAADQGLE
jgi:hypothetical protein